MCLCTQSPVRSDGCAPHCCGRHSEPFSESPAGADTALAFPFQVFTLLLLSAPRALGGAAELEVPLSSPVFSLLFYLVLLLLWAVHIGVCTSAEGSCYFCSLSWPTVGAVLVLVSALLCVATSALTRTCVDGKLLRRVRLAPAGTAPSFWIGHVLLFTWPFTHRMLGKALVRGRHSAGQGRKGAGEGSLSPGSERPLETLSSVSSHHRPHLSGGKTGFL